MEIRTREQARRHAASNITSLQRETINDASDILNMLEANSYDGPEIIYYYEAWDIINDTDAPDPHDTPDFSGCDNAKACCMLEAQLIMDAAYDEALDGLISDLQEGIDGLDDETDLAYNAITLGESGLGWTPHDEERDIGDGNLCIWRTYHTAELTINGISLTISLDD